MLRGPLWLTSILGACLALAMSCGSDDANPARATGGQGEGGAGAVDANLGGGGPDAAGTAAGTAAGSAGDVGDASANGGAAAGGAATGELTDGWLSGTRLRAVLDAAGDAKRFKVWHDSELDIDCAFSPDSSKVERCLPIVEHGYAAYSDAKCTKAVGLFAAGDAIPP